VAIDPQIRRSLVSTIYVAARNGASTSGDPSFDDPVAVAARVEHMPRRVISGAGEEITSEAQVVTESVIPMLSRVWLPGSDKDVANDAIVPIRTDKAYDEKGGVSHYVTHFG
jgi:hypothetical protein